MKFIAIILVVVVAASAKETFQLPQEIVDKIYKQAIPCADENKVDHSMIKKLADGTLPRDDATNKFLFCFVVKSGYVTEDAKIIIDKLSNIVGGHPRYAEFKEALVKCDEITKENPIETVAAKNACFADLPPVRLLI